jgi:precorrin-6B methylase 1
MTCYQQKGNFLPGQVAITKISWIEPIISKKIKNILTYEYNFQSLTSMPLTNVLTIPRFFLRNFSEKDFVTLPKISSFQNATDGLLLTLENISTPTFKLEFQVESNLSLLDITVEVQNLT